MPLSNGRIIAASSPPKRILIIKPSSLGDIIHALPVLALLRNAYPEAHIAWLAGTSFAALLRGHPMLDEVIPFDRARYGRMLRSPTALRDFLRFLARIRAHRFDLVLDLQGLFRSGFISFISGARRRIGFASAREAAWLFYNQRVRCPSDVRHAVDRNLCVAADLGLRIDRAHFPLPITDDERRSARATVASQAHTDRFDAPFLALVPGARWATKLWPAERIAKLIDRMAERGLPRCVLLGSPDDRPWTDQILRHTAAMPLDLVGRTTLREMSAIISLADAVICHDSGPMHIAAAMGKPIVALFGPTDPARTGPYAGARSTSYARELPTGRPGDGPVADGAHSPSVRIISQPITCAPCLSRKCLFRPTDSARYHACMAGISIDVVLDAVTQIVGAPQNTAAAPHI